MADGLPQLSSLPSMSAFQSPRPCQQDIQEHSPAYHPQTTCCPESYLDFFCQLVDWQQNFGTSTDIWLEEG